LELFAKLKKLTEIKIKNFEYLLSKIHQTIKVLFFLMLVKNY